MAEIGLIGSVVQIADVGLRLSIKLYTFGEIVASADRSVISISKDISLTSGVLKELGKILDQDRETRTFSENAVQTADGVVKECLEVFQEMDNILVKKMPSLAKGDGRDGKSGERTNKAMVMLERLKWGYLQPKLQLLRSNLDRLKSTLLLMLNVITYARQVSGKTESPSVIAEQRSLIEDLAHSNREYIREFERLKLGIDGTAVEQVDDASNIEAIEREPSTTTRLLPGAPNRKFERMKPAVGGISLQDKENAWGLGSREFTTATKAPPKAQSSVTRSLLTPPNASISNVFINTSVQTNIGMPSVQERGIPAIEAPMGFDQEVLFKQLEHYSMLIKNLLKEVDEAQYKITFKSRLRVKGGIAGLHESERQELERIWGGSALQTAEQRLETLVEGLGQLPRMHGFTSRDPALMFRPDDVRRMGKSPSMTPNREPENREQEEAAVWLPQATPDGRLFYLNSVTGASLMEDLPQMPISVNEAAAKDRRIIGVPENTRSPTDGMDEAYTRNNPILETDYYPSNKIYIKTSDSVPRALTDNSRIKGTSVSFAEADTKPAKGEIQKQGVMFMRARTLRRKNVKALALSAAPTAVSAPSVGDAQLSGTPRRDVDGTNYPTIGMKGRRTGHERLDQTQNLRGRTEMPEDARSSMSVESGEDRKPEALPVEKKDSPAPGEHFRQSQEEFGSERREKVDSSREPPKEREPMAQTSILRTVRPKDLMADSVPAPPSGTFGYSPMPVTSANDSPDMAHSTETSQLFKEELFADDSDKWPSLFNQNEEETNTDVVSPSAGLSLSSTYVAPNMSRNHYRKEISVEQSSQSFERSRYSYKPQPAVIIEDPNDTGAVKRARNTVAARKSREKRMERTEELASQVTQLEAEAEHWKSIALSLGQRIGDSDVGDTESHQKGHGTAEGRADVATQPRPRRFNVSFLGRLAARQSETILRQGTNSAVPDQLAPEQPDTTIANRRLASPTAPPILQTTSKANPKGKKVPRERKKPAEMSSMISVPLTPAAEAAQPATLTPAIPVISHASSFAPPKVDGQGPANMISGMTSAAPDQLAPQQQDTAMSGFVDGGVEDPYTMPFNSDLNNSDILENFDFEHFLQTTDGNFNFDPSTFEEADVTEITEPEAPFAGLEGCAGVKGGTVEDQDRNTPRLVGRAVEEDGNICNENGSIPGHAEPYEYLEEVEFEKEEENEEVKADLSILKGSPVNKQGNVIGPEGIPIGCLVEGSAKELAGKLCDKEGQIWNDSGKVIGRCELIPENEREAKPEGSFAGLEGCVVVKDAFVVDEDGRRVGVVVEGDAKRLLGRAVDEDGDIVDKYGNVKGHAELYEEPEEEIADLSCLEEKVVDKHGNVVDEHGVASGHIVEGDLEELVGGKVDGRGQISNDNGEVVGQAELLLGRGMQVQERPFADIQNLMDPSTPASAMRSHAPSVEMNSQVLPPTALYVRALYNYESDDKTSLSFRQGDIIQVITQLTSGWWYGVIKGVRGWFPSNYCVVVTGPEDTTAKDGPQLRNGGDVISESYTDEEYEEYEEFDNRYEAIDGTDKEQKEAAFWIPQATSDGRLFYFNTLTGVSAMEVPLETPTSTNETDPRNRINIHVPDQTRPPETEMMARDLERDEDESETGDSASELEKSSMRSRPDPENPVCQRDNSFSGSAAEPKMEAYRGFSDESKSATLSSCRLHDVPDGDEREQGDSRLVDMEVVDHLVSLWTTVKPL